MIIFDTKWVFLVFVPQIHCLSDQIFPLGLVGSQCFLGFYSSKDTISATL